MKICPSCQRTYPDDSLNYCLDDGSVLTSAPAGREAETVLMSAPPPTTVGQPLTTAFPVVSPTAPYGSPEPQRRSRAWLWAVLVLVGVMVLCGGGFGGIFWWASRHKPDVTDRNTQDQSEKKDDTPDTTDNRDDHGTTETTETGSGLTLEKYRQLKDGMSYKEVVAILGEGSVISDSSGGGVRSVTYQWMGDNFEMIILTFQNDRLNSKTQVGLESSGSDNKTTSISREKYDRLKEGITYKEAVSIMGSDGEEQFNSNIAGFKLATYQWKGSGYSSITVTFQNDKLQSKSQTGL